jgi:hypothetical protein
MKPTYDSKDDTVLKKYSMFTCQTPPQEFIQLIRESEIASSP